MDTSHKRRRGAAPPHSGRRQSRLGSARHPKRTMTLRGLIVLGAISALALLSQTGSVDATPVAIVNHTKIVNCGQADSAIECLSIDRGLAEDGIYTARIIDVTSATGSCDARHYWTRTKSHVEVAPGCIGQFAVTEKVMMGTPTPAKIQTVTCDVGGGTFRSCPTGVNNITSVRLTQTNADQNCNDRWSASDTYIDVETGCGGTFAVEYYTDLGSLDQPGAPAMAPDAPRPYHVTEFSCTNPSTTEYLNCDPNLRTEEDLVNARSLSTNGSCSSWKIRETYLRLNPGCSMTAELYFRPADAIANGPCQTLRSTCIETITVQCGANAVETEDGPSQRYTICNAEVDGDVLSVDPISSEHRDCESFTGQKRFHLDGLSMHVYDGCVASFSVAYDGQYQTLAVEHPYTRKQQRCVQPGGTGICDLHVTDVAHVMMVETLAGTCNPGNWTHDPTHRDGNAEVQVVRLQNCSALFDVFYNEELHLPFESETTWHTYRNTRHGNAEFDMQPQTRGERNFAPVLASASGTLTYVCGLDDEVGIGHAQVRLDTPEHGIFDYLHLDFDDAEERYGEAGNTTDVAQGDIIGLLSPNIDDQAGGCPMDSTGPHLHWELPTVPVTIDGFEFAATNAEHGINCLASCALKSENTLLDREGARREPRERPAPTPPEPTPVCQVLTNGDFSNGLAGWQSIWGNSTAEAGGMAVTDGVRGQQVDATPGTSYTVTGSYRTVGWTGGRDVGIDFLDASGMKLSDQKAGLDQADTMTSFQATATAPAGTTKVLVWVWSGSSGKTIVDDITLGQTGCSPETPEPPNPEPPAPSPPEPTPACQMLTNGDFANGLANWQSNWGASAAEGGAMAITNGVRIQQVSGVAGTSYTVTGQYRTVDWTGGRDVGIDFLDASGTKLAQTTAGLDQSETMTSFQATATAPAGTTGVAVWVWSGASGKTIVDNITLKPSNCDA